MRLSRLFIITGDASGDQHGSAVIRRMQAMMPDVEIQAIGGAHIAETGVTMLETQQHMGVAGLGFVGSIPKHYSLGRQILTHFKAWRPDAVLLIDYGMFNLWIAQRLRKTGIKVFYYIPPQVWASRPQRIFKIKKFVDHVFCIFPFEVELYASHGIPVTYVGHPVLENIAPAPDRQAFCRKHKLDHSQPIVGIFPGSRRMEMTHNLPPMIKALPLIAANTGHRLQFVLARSSAVPDAVFQEALASVRHYTDKLIFRVVEDESQAVLALSKAAMVAAGTVTLEAACYRTPVLVMYKLSWINTIGFKVVYKNVKHLALPNMLAGEGNAFLPELFPDRVTPQTIADGMLPLLTDARTIKETQKHYNQVLDSLGAGHAAENVVNAIRDLMADTNEPDRMLNNPATVVVS